MSMERDALMREVDEELRRDRLKKMWEQHGTYLLAGAVALLVGVGGYKWWEGRRAAAAERAGVQFEQALDLTTAGSTEDARRILQSISTGSGAGYALLANLALAGQSAKTGDVDAAIASYDAAAARTGDQLIKDYARLQSTALRIDKVDFTEVQNRLNDLTGERSPWRFLAREVVGVAAMRAGRMDDARLVLAPLAADPRAPTSVRERAASLMNLVVAADLERTAPGKVELEPTDPPAASPDPAAPKSTPPAKGGAAVAPKGGTAKGK